MSCYTIHNLPEIYLRPGGAPEFDVGILNSDDKERYMKRRRAVEAYLNTKELVNSAKEAGISHSELIRNFKRFATITSGGLIAGWPALAPYVHVQIHSSAKAKETESGKGREFQTLLRDHEDVERTLQTAIQSRISSEGYALSRKSKKAVYNEFKKSCAHLSINEYPWTYESAAKASVYRYITSFLTDNTDSYDIWYGRESEKRLRIGNGKQSFCLADRPFSIVSVDAHMLDVIGTVTIETKHGPKTIAIRRIWLVVLHCTYSQAVLGYSVSLEEEVSGETIEDAVLFSQTPWKRRELSKGLQYSKAAGFPAGKIEGLPHCPIVSQSFDNFSSHYSTAVVTTIKQALPCHVTYGAVGAWWTNSRLERLFGELEAVGIHKYSISTGSHPNDGLRHGDPVGEAIRQAVSFGEIVDLVEVTLADLNGTRRSSLGDMSPLEVISNHLNDPRNAMLVRPKPLPHPNAPRLGWVFIRIKVAGAQKKGNVRNASINLFGKLAYSSEVLCRRRDLIGKTICIYVRRFDLRVEAFDQDGAALGELSPSVKGRRISWQEMRLLLRGRNREDLPEEVLDRYKQALQKRAAQDVEQQPDKISQAASELAQLELKRNQDETREARSSSVEATVPLNEDRHEEARTDEVEVTPAFVPRVEFGKLKRVV